LQKAHVFKIFKQEFCTDVIYFDEVNYMNSCELVSLVTALACAIAKCAPEEDLPIITAILGQLASTLATITVNEERCDDKQKQLEAAPNNDTANNQNRNSEPPVEVVPDTSIITVPPRAFPPGVLTQEIKKGI
jgi:hypothetical protein